MGNQASQQLQLRASSVMTKLLLKSQQQVIQHLTQQQIQLNRPINQMGDRIAHYAAYKSMYRLLQWLIQKDANFQHCFNHRRLTPIDVAVPETREWIYKRLKEYHLIKMSKINKAQNQNKLRPMNSIQSVKSNQSPQKGSTTIHNEPETPIEDKNQSEKVSETIKNQIQGSQKKKSIDLANILFNTKQ